MVVVLVNTAFSWLEASPVRDLAPLPKQLSVIVPTYRELENIPALTEKVLKGVCACGLWLLCNPTCERLATSLTYMHARTRTHTAISSIHSLHTRTHAPRHTGAVTHARTQTHAPTHTTTFPVTATEDAGIDAELILVDDNSQDGSVEKVQELQGEGYKVTYVLAFSRVCRVVSVAL